MEKVPFRALFFGSGASCSHKHLWLCWLGCPRGGIIIDFLGEWGRRRERERGAVMTSREGAFSLKKAFLLVSILSFGMGQFVNLANDFPTYFDTYGSTYDGEPRAFIIRCEASQGQTCVQSLALDCSDVGCADCLSNSEGQTCDQTTDDMDYILLPDTEVYFSNQLGEVGINLEELQILAQAENGTMIVWAPLVKLFISVLEAPILPTPIDQNVATQVDAPVTITLDGVNQGGEDFEVYVTSQPLFGTLTLTNGDPIVLGEGIDSREVVYTGSFVGTDEFFFGVRSAPDVVGGGSTGALGTVEIALETNTVEGTIEQVVNVLENNDVNFDLDLINPNGLSFDILLESSTLGKLRTQAAPGVLLSAGDTFSTASLLYTSPNTTSQFGSDFFDFTIWVSSTQVGFGSVLFKLSTAGAPGTTTFTTISVDAGVSTCIDLTPYTDGALTSSPTFSNATFFISALIRSQDGSIRNGCPGLTFTEPGPLLYSFFELTVSSILAGSYTTALEWTVTETATGLSSGKNMIYFDVVDQANTRPVAIATTISVRQASSGTLFLTGYSPLNNPLQAEIVSCPSRTTRGALYQTTTGAVIFCDRNNGNPIRVDSDDGTVLYQADTGLPSYTYRARFQMRDIVTDETSELSPVTIFVKENQTPVALGGEVVGIEDFDLVIDRSGGQGWGTDPDGDALTVFISRAPQKGSLYQYREDSDGNVITPDSARIVVFEPVILDDPFNRVTFQPQPNQNGSPYDAFSFVVKDDLNATSNEQRIIITIQARPDPPTARTIFLPNQLEDELFNIALLGDDPDQDDVLSSQITSLPSLGDLYQFDSCKNNVCTNPITRATLQDPVDVINIDQKVWYLPRKDLSGPDFFRYRVSDGSRFSDQGSVNITLNDVNDPPVAFNDTIQVEFAEEETIELRVTDIDDRESDLVAIITSLPEGGRLFQVSDNGEIEASGDIVQVPTTVTNPDRLVVYRAIGFGVEPSTTYTFTYYGRDADRAISETGTITLDVSQDNRDDGGGGISIGVIIGPVCAVVLILIVLLWYLRKRRLAKDKERNVFALLYNNKSSIELLENILIEEDMAVILALAEHLTGSELDDFGESMVAIFSSHGMVMKVIKHFLSLEIQNTEDSATLFRLNCVATALMKYYSKDIGLDYLKGTLMELMEQTLSNVGAYEVDTRKLQEGQDLDENWVRLKEATHSYLLAITESVDDCPLEFREIYAYLLKEIEKKFPKCKNSHTFIGGFIFLRFFCPSMITPEGYRLLDTVPTQAERRGLILISKALQNLSNNVQFGNKEAFMKPMNPFIVENLQRTKRFLEEVSTYPQVTDEQVEAIMASRAPVSAERKEDALQSAHRLLCEYKDEVLKDLEDNTEEEVQGEAEDPLQDFKDLVDMDSSDWEAIGKKIVNNMAIIRAFCRSLQSQEISQALITVFEAHDKTMKILSDLIKGECGEASKNPNMLLRGNGTAFKMFKCYVEIIGLDYLQKTLSMMVKFICNNSSSYEIDISKCEEGTTEDDIKENAERLKEAVSEMWSQIMSSVNQMPIQIRVLCRHLFMEVSETAPERAHTVTGDFIFNRMLGPAIVTPMAYGLMDDEPSPSSRRALLLVTKVMMMIVHDIQIADTKEAFLRPLSHMVVDLNEEFRKFIENVINVNPKAVENDPTNYKITPALLQDSVESVFKQMKDPRTNAQMRSLLTPDAREKGTVAERLRNILQDLGPAATRKKRVLVPQPAQ